VPTYSYRCTQCDNAFDIHQDFSDSSLTECPVCGGALRKVYGSIGVTFNGTGFYRTDSRASGVSSSSESSSSSSSDSSSKSSDSGSSSSSTPSATPSSGSSGSASSGSSSPSVSSGSSGS
jgi:putative FmdB family regulatory protein